MKPIFVAPLVALALAGGGVGAYFAVASEGTGEEAAVAEATPTPIPTSEPTLTVRAQETLTPTAPTTAGTPTPDEWTTYVDAELGFSFPHPQGLTVSEQSFDFFGKGAESTLRMRAITFQDSSGVMVLSLGITPNPGDLGLQEWMDTHDPCASSLDPTLPQPESITIAGQSGLLCPIDQLMQPNPRVYFRGDDHVFVLIANVYGIAESGFPPALTEADFQKVVGGFGLGP